MSDPIAPSEGSTQTLPPATPATVFQDTSTPEWVKTAGLQAAHDKGTQTAQPTAPAAAPAAPAAQPAAAPVPAAPAAQTPPPAAPLTIDHAALAKAIREGNQPAPTGPTDEELSRQLGIVHVTPEIYKQAFGVDGTPEQIKGLNDYGQAIAKQAVTIASVLFKRELQEFKDSMSPYTAVVQQQEAGRIKTEFFKKHADLGGYEELVTQQYQLAKASGRKFDSIEAAGTFVAEQTRSVLKSLGITPAAPAVPNGTQSPGKSAPQTRQMAPHAMGGKGGSTPSATTPKSASEQVWG